MDTKKLIAVAFAAVAVGASAEVVSPVDSIDFESLAVGANVTNYFAGNQWICEGDSSSNIVVASFHGRDRNTTGDRGRPDVFASSNDTQVLQVLCSEPLYRTINAYGAGQDTISDVPAYTASGTTYFDMLVKFTPSEVAPIPVTTDKIVVWVNAESNLVVTAKKLVPASAGQLGVDEANFTNTTSLVSDQWHRVTVVAVPTIAVLNEWDATIPAFKVYIDGVLQTFSESAIGEEALNTLETDYGTLVEDLREAIGQNALLLSLELNNDGVVEANEATGLKATGFQGIGYVDEYVFTTVEPAFFSPATTEYAFTLIWTDANVSAVTYQIGEGSPVSTVLAENSFTTNLTVGTVVTVAATPTNDWYKVTGGTGTVEIVDAPVTNIIVTTLETDTSSAGLDIKDSDLAKVDADKIKEWAESQNPKIQLATLQDSTTTGAYDSYLLNMPIAEYEMKVVSIAPNEENATKWDVTVAVYIKNSDEERAIPSTVNGKIYVRSASSLDDWATATPSEVATADIDIEEDSGYSRKVITITPQDPDASFFEVSVK